MKNLKIIFASNNSGKIHELQNLLSSSNVNFILVPQSELGVDEVEETGLTFVENALLKARYACEKTGLPAIGDDSGLVVDALKGAPGIYSARFAGKKAASQANIEKLLHELRDVPAEERTAHFHCTLVYLTHAEDPDPLICQGKWYGTILKTPRGTQGFGYDPVFFDANENRSAAELPLEIKNRISHRGKALQLLTNALKVATQCEHSQ